MQTLSAVKERALLKSEGSCAATEGVVRRRLCGGSHPAVSQDQQEGRTEGEVAGGGMKGTRRSPVTQGLIEVRGVGWGG